MQLSTKFFHRLYPHAAPYHSIFFCSIFFLIHDIFFLIHDKQPVVCLVGGVVDALVDGVVKTMGHQRSQTVGKAKWAQVVAVGEVRPFHFQVRVQNLVPMECDT